MISMTKSQCEEEKDNADEEDFGLKFKLTTFPANHFGPNFDEDVLLSKEDFPSLNLMTIQFQKARLFFNQEPYFQLFTQPLNVKTL